MLAIIDNSSYYNIFALMGNCMGLKSESRYESKEKFDVEPTDTTTLDPQSYPVLNLKTLLTKLKVKRCNNYVIQ